MRSKGHKPVVLAILATYKPGNDATGPVQSLRAFAKALSGDVDVKIVANSDDGDTSMGWQLEDVASRRPLHRGRFTARGLLALLRETPHDLLMLNSFHDHQFVIPILIWRRVGLIPRKPTMLAPRGELAKSALSIKALRKRLYLRVVRLFLLTNEIWLHATSELERRDIEAVCLPNKGILLAPNVHLLPDLPDIVPSAVSRPLRIAFLGRVVPIKNLDYALDVLGRVEVAVEFNIYGPTVDLKYWNQLQAQILKLPDNIRVVARGVLPHHQVVKTLAEHDLFFLPTKGENFGHAINEALSSGLPVLIANTTPWRGLKVAGAGWDLTLSRPELFVQAIEEMASLDVEKRLAMRASARRFAELNFSVNDAISVNRRMILEILGTSGSDAGDH